MMMKILLRFLSTRAPSVQDMPSTVPPNVGWHDVEVAPPRDPLRPYRRDEERPRRADGILPPPARKVGRRRIPETGRQRYQRLKGPQWRNLLRADH